MKITDDVRQAYRDAQASAFGMLDARILADALRDALAEAEKYKFAASEHTDTSEGIPCWTGIALDKREACCDPRHDYTWSHWQQEADRMLRGEIDAD